MEQFITLERAIACPRASVAVAADTAAQVLTAAGYRRGLGFGPTQSYVRAYRPTWAVVLAVLLAPLAGLGLLLLLVRSKDHCNVVIEDGPYGVVALVSGRVPATLPAALEAATGTYPQSSGHGGSPQPPPHMLLSPSSGGFDAPPQQPAILRPATPVPGMFAQPPQPPAYPGAPSRGAAESPYGAPSRPEMPPPPPPPAGPPEYAGDQRHPGQPADPRRQPARPPAPEPDDDQEQAARAPEQPAPVAFRPPSRLAPPIPPDSPSARGAGGGRGAGAPDPTVRHSDEDPFSSTSGRVPWAVTGGGSRGPAMPAPAGPPPISPPAWSPHVPPEGAPAAAGSGSGRTGGGAPGGPGGTGGRSAAVRAEPGTVATAVGHGGYVLRVDSGETLEVGPFCLLGREPVARDGDPPGPILVRFDDVKLSVSKTHLAYGVDGHGFWVMDRNSTNGTTIIDESGHRTPCAPGAREYVPVGAQVQIGQRRLTVEGPDGDD